MSELDIFCKDTIESVFPDLQALRERCIADGCVPSQYRGDIWNLLLSGNNVSDDEIFKECVRGSRVFDVYEIGKIWNIPGLEGDLQDIINLFCRRMNREYQNYMTHILIPLLVSGTPLKKQVASSCFYNLCTSFLPLYGYSWSGQTSFEMAKNSVLAAKQCTWLRLLVGYHFPKLLLHLDSVFPDWECLVDADLPTHEKKRSGIIHTSWLCAMFAGTLLRPDTLLMLWDWGILWDCCKASTTSVFLTVALLGVCETRLLQLDTPRKVRKRFVVIII
jgi:hypothetical protein